MKKKELLDLRKKEVSDLKNLAAAKRIEIVKARMEMKAKKQKNLKIVKNLSHDLAQILTIIREKEILEKEGK